MQMNLDEYDARMNRAAAMFRMLGPVIADMKKLGADNQAIANVFKVVVEELETAEPESRG